MGFCGSSSGWSGSVIGALYWLCEVWKESQLSLASFGLVTMSPAHYFGCGARRGVHFDRCGDQSRSERAGGSKCVRDKPTEHTKQGVPWSLQLVKSYKCMSMSRTQTHNKQANKTKQQAQRPARYVLLRFAAPPVPVPPESSLEFASMPKLAGGRQVALRSL